MMTGSNKYKFSGHQTFTFRYGWLEKGVRGVAAEADLFSREDALVKLGVGKNMVDSIRHWCQLAQLVEQDDRREKPNSRFLRPTEIAARLLLDGGWDPYLEDDASLWLIQWLIVSNAGIQGTWQLVFSDFHRPDFSKRELIGFIKSITERHSLKVKDSVIARDVDCFLHTYVTGMSGKKLATPEEGFSCPLLELGIIQLTLDGDLFRFAIGPKPSLPASVFAFALDRYFASARHGRQTMTVQDCLYGSGSPGQAFKLDENSIIEYVETLEEMTKGAIGIDETAGLKQIYRRGKFMPEKLLDQHYGRKER